MKTGEIRKLCVDKYTDLKTVLTKMNEGAERILFVVEQDHHLFGVLTDGDIRRWIISTGELQGEAHEFCNTKPVVVRPDYSQEAIKELMLTQKLEAIPVVDQHNKILDILFWEDVFDGRRTPSTKPQIDVPVVIMAGGKGTRLDPFTRILPKPLIPIGDKPVIEIIIDKFREYGMQEFYLSVNHKSKMIKAYFEESRHAYNVYYLEEDEPLGTAGSLKLLEGQARDSFFVSNCDILIESDYQEILAYHREKKNDITLVAAVKNYRIPYGVCEIENGGTLRLLKEKPEYHLLVNTGFYILKASTLSLIPARSCFDMTHLIAAAKEQGRKIGVFPVNDHAWIDVGEWEEYKQAVQKFSFA